MQLRHSSIDSDLMRAEIEKAVSKMVEQDPDFDQLDLGPPPVEQSEIKAVITFPDIQFDVERIQREFGGIPMHLLPTTEFDVTYDYVDGTYYTYDAPTDRGYAASSVLGLAHTLSVALRDDMYVQRVGEPVVSPPPNGQ